MELNDTGRYMHDPIVPQMEYGSQQNGLELLPDLSQILMRNEAGKNVVDLMKQNETVRVLTL